MDGKFRIERRWFPAGEGIGSTDRSAYFLSMPDSNGTFVEWEAQNNGKRHRNRVIAGDTWVLPPGQAWWSRREAGKTCIQLSLSASWLRQATQSLFEIRSLGILRDPFLAHSLRALADTVNTSPQNPTSALYQESPVTTLALHLVTRYSSDSENPESGVTPLSPNRLRAISNYISERLFETISLIELAEIAGLGISQFSLRFREATGQTPHQFVTAMRVDRARELLIQGRHTPADVAALTGFADQSHLTRHVRRAFGVTPGALAGRSP